MYCVHASDVVLFSGDDAREEPSGEGVFGGRSELAPVMLPRGERMDVLKRGENVGAGDLGDPWDLREVV